MTSIEEAAASFEGVASRIESVWLPHIPLDTTFRERSWQDSPLTPRNAIWFANKIAKELRAAFASDDDPDTIEAPEFWEAMSEQADELDFSNFNSNPQIVGAATFRFLQYCYTYLPTKPADVDWQKVKSKGYIPRDLARKIGSIEKRIEGLNTRSEGLQEKIGAIEAAHDAAEQLPTDMEELRRNNEEIRKLLAEAQRTSTLIETTFEESGKLREKIEQQHKITSRSVEESNVLVEKCNENYRITTSAGLAGAFEARSKSLSRTGWFWVFLLASALVCAVGIGYFRIDAYETLLRDGASTSVILLNLLVTILGVGGPIWLAWLSTKNIGQSFKLAEDYAFKASISKAYEGYRKEAVNLDPEFAKQLFGSALTRLDEAPSRFISSIDHNSPMSEMLDNPTVKKFVAAFPEMQDKMIKFAMDQKNLTVGAVTSAATTATGKSRQNGPVEESREKVSEDT